MTTIPFTATGTASHLLTLSKVAWKLGSSLTKLDRYSAIVEEVKGLADETKSLSAECDLVYAELEEVAHKIETGIPPPYTVDGRIWTCLSVQVEETRRTIHELEWFIQNSREDDVSPIGQVKSSQRLDASKIQVADFRGQVCRHTVNFSTTLLLLKTILAHIPPRRADRDLADVFDQLKAVVENQQKPAEANQRLRPSHTETSLLYCALEFIGKSTLVYEEALAVNSANRGQGTSSMHVAEWKSALESMRQDQACDYTNVRREIADTSGDVSDDDFNIDLAEAALKTGTESFEEQDWLEADFLLQDALRLLQDLSVEQRAFCDIFRLHHQLAVCAFHTREPDDAEEALASLVQLSPNCNEQQGYIYEATHFLSLLYIRMGKIDRALSECEKALRGRRKLLGKDDDTSLESTALMAHIYILFNNPRRAKTIMVMIPEARRDAVIKSVEGSLRMKVEHLDLSSKRTSSISEGSEIASCRTEDRLSVHSVALYTEGRGPSAIPAIIPRGPTSIPQQSHRRLPSQSTGFEDPASPSSSMSMSPAQSPRQFRPRPPSWTEKPELQPVVVGTILSPVPPIEPDTNIHMHNRMHTLFDSAASHMPSERNPQSRPRIPSLPVEVDIRPTKINILPLDDQGSETLSRDQRSANEDGIANTEVTVAVSLNPVDHERDEVLERPALSRKEILERIGCLPRDDIEDAVCDGNQVAFANLLSSKSEIWRSRLRKRVRPERITALHFAALFNEIDMARRLVDAKFNVNEIPWGYSTTYTPLKFAIGARQVAMVEFLIAKGATPTVPESWSSLAGQLMNRSWLRKTMSEAGKDDVPDRMMAILRILLNHGLDVNGPVDASGSTLLHQAVTFGSSQDRWDLDFRATMTSFLGGKGASPFQANVEGKTPRDLALASGSQDLLLMFGRGSSVKELAVHVKDPVELSC